MNGYSNTKNLFYIVAAQTVARVSAGGTAHLQHPGLLLLREGLQERHPRVREPQLYIQTSVVGGVCDVVEFSLLGRRQCFRLCVHGR